MRRTDPRLATQKAHFMTEVLTGVIPSVGQRQQRQMLSAPWSDPQRPRASPSSPGMNLKTSCKQEAMQGHTAVMFSFLLYGLLWVCLALFLAADPRELTSYGQLPLNSP